MKKRSQPIRLLAPDAPPGPAERFAWIWRPLLAWCLFLGFGGWLIATFSLPCISWAVALLALGILLLWESFGRDPKRVFLLIAAAIFLSLLLWMLTARYTRAGLELFSNAATRLITIRELRILPQYDVKIAQYLHPACVTLLLIPPALLLAILCGISIRRSLPSVVIVMTVLALIVSVAFRCYAGAVWLSAVFFVLCWMIGRKHLNGMGETAAIVPTAALLGGVLLLALVCGGAPDSLSDRFEAERSALHRQQHTALYGGEGIPLPEGQLSQAAGFSPTQSAALTVSGDPGGSLYLRGFLGRRSPTANGRRWTARRSIPTVRCFTACTATAFTPSDSSPR